LNFIGLTLDCPRNLCGQDARAPGRESPDFNIFLIKTFNNIAFELIFRVL